MYQIAIVTEKKNKFDNLVRGFEIAGNCSIKWNDSLASTLELVAEAPPNLLIIDESVEQQDSLSIARQVILVNAMLNQAVVSPLSKEDFHETSEGLGIMAQLTPDLKAEDARTLIQQLDEMP
jgi:hypothetical protein